MKKVGLLINPIAGMGGSVGLKGTDGATALRKAIRYGAKPLAEEKTETALKALSTRRNLEFFAGSGEMGEGVLRRLRLETPPVIFHHHRSRTPYSTTREDTIRIARHIAEEKVDLMLFCGGDGTARDLLDAVDQKITVLGVPAGVKMHSAVFAVTPQAAGSLARHFLEDGLELREAEVMDVDEAAYRKGKLAVKLYGYLSLPQEPFLIQGAKAVMPESVDERENVEAIARQVVEEMKPETLYILCAGTTVKAVADQLHQPKTLLGVDVFKNGHRVAEDVSEKDLLRLIKGEKDVKIIVSPIGHQGHIFGRGTQQVSPRILRRVGRENVIIIGSQAKISQLNCLYVDTGDTEVDAIFRGYMRVVIDYRLWRVVQVC